MLCAGRATLDDQIDHGVGIEVLGPVGTEVRAGDAVLLVRHRQGRGLAEAVPLLEQAVAIADRPPEDRPLVVETIS
jgi:thymidine phosphorylase